MSMLGVGVASRLPGCTPYVNSSLDSPTLYKYDRQMHNMGITLSLMHNMGITLSLMHNMGITLSL